jgi:hypothetical protein
MLGVADRLTVIGHQSFLEARSAVGLVRIILNTTM